MSARVLGFAAVVIVGAVFALIVALRQGDPPPPVPDEALSDGGASRASPAAPDPEPPALPPAPPPAPRARPPALDRDKPATLGTTGADERPMWESYDDEQRDAAWARDQELAIRNRLRPLLDGANRDRPGTVRVPHVECREVHCRLLITGTDKTAFLSFVESLQDERGFYGDADLLALDGYGETVDKRTGRATQEVAVFLKYER